MGKQRGEKLGDMIRAKRDRWIGSAKPASIDEKAVASKLHEVREAADKSEDAINKKFPEITEELKGIANGARIPYEDLKLMLLGYIPSKEPFKPDLMKPQVSSSGLPVEECSSFAATGPATSDGVPLIAKNGDYSAPQFAGCGWGLIEEDACLIYAEPADGNRYIAVGAYPEWPGNSEGLNEKGLALCGSGVTPYYETKEAYAKAKPVGVPIHYLQSVIYAKCDNVEDALAYLEIAPRGYNGRNLNMVDTDGHVLKAEVSFEHLNLIRPYVNANYAANWFVAGTSHFASDKMNWMGPQEEEYPSTYRRFERIMALLTRHAGTIDFDFAKQVMRDHAYGPGGWSICRHGPVHTLASYIMQPTLGRVWCCVGHPCENEYEAFGLEK
jgi:hypothetical protein